MPRTLSATLFAAALLLFTASAAAQSLPLGGRTASMAGAAASSGRDSAMALLNPAGLALVPRDALSLSASLYTWTSVGIDGYFIPAETDPALGQVLVDEDRLASEDFISFPGSVSTLLHLGPVGPVDKQVVAATIIVPEFTRLAFQGNLKVGVDQTNSIRSTVGLTRDRTSWVFGPSYAMSIGALRVGLSPMFLFRTATNTSDANDFSTVQNGQFFIDSQQTAFAESWSLGLSPVVGFQLQLGGFSVGGAAELATVPLSSGYEAQFRTVFSSPPGAINPSEVADVSEEGQATYRRPTLVRVGVGYEVEGSFALNLDVEALLPEEVIHLDIESDTTRVTQGAPPQATSEDLTITTDTDLALAFRLGAEVFVGTGVALRVGGFYEQSNIPPFERVAEEQLTFRLDRLGLSAGLGYTFGGIETTYGVSWVLGLGDTVVGDAFSEVGQQNFEVVGVDHQQVIFFISGTVEFEALKEELEGEIKDKTGLEL